MRWLLWAMTAGLLVKLAFSAVIGHWVPLSHPTNQPGTRRRRRLWQEPTRQRIGPRKGTVAAVGIHAGRSGDSGGGRALCFPWVPYAPVHNWG
jgi:hypothetical protein